MLSFPSPSDAHCFGLRVNKRAHKGGSAHMHSDGGCLIPGESNCLCTEVFIINTNILPFLWLWNNKIQELCVCTDVFDLFKGWLLPQHPCGIRRRCNNKQEIYIEERLLFVKLLLITADFLALCVCLKVSSTHPALTSPRFCHGSKASNVWIQSRTFSWETSNCIRNRQILCI